MDCHLDPPLDDLDLAEIPSLVECAGCDDTFVDEELRCCTDCSVPLCGGCAGEHVCGFTGPSIGDIDDFLPEDGAGR